MSVLTVVQTKASNDFKAAANYKSATCTAVGSGNSLIFIITALTAELPFVIEPQAYNGTTDVPMVQIASDTSTAGMTRYLYKLDNITHAATSIRYKVNASSGSTQQSSTLWEIGNTGGSALTMRVDQKTSKTLNTSFSESFTTISANELAIVNLRWSLSNPTAAATAPFSLVTHVNSGIDDLYKADMGAAGSQSVAFTTGSAVTAAVWITTFSNTSLTPTVSTVSSNSATEGSTITHTVTLSGATSAESNYAATLVGVTATGSGTDFTSNLASATYSNGVTFSGGNMVVPTAVSSFTVGIATATDTTDEVDETYTLTVGGVSGTGTITDDDAPPTVSISDATESFGTVTHTLTLSQASSKTITVQVDSANGSKTAGTHYTAIVAQTVTFNPGETEQTVVVTVL